MHMPQRDHSLSPVEPQSRRNSIQRGARVAESGSLHRSSSQSRRNSLERGGRVAETGQLVPRNHLDGHSTSAQASAASPHSSIDRPLRCVASRRAPPSLHRRASSRNPPHSRRHSLVRTTPPTARSFKTQSIPFTRVLIINRSDSPAPPRPSRSPQILRSGLEINLPVRLLVRSSCRTNSLLTHRPPIPHLPECTPNERNGARVFFQFLDQHLSCAARVYEGWVFLSSSFVHSCRSSPLFVCFIPRSFFFLSFPLSFSSFFAFFLSSFSSFFLSLFLIFFLVCFRSVFHLPFSSFFFPFLLSFSFITSFLLSY